LGVIAVDAEISESHLNHCLVITAIGEAFQVPELEVISEPTSGLLEPFRVGGELFTGT
jgi:hypothetical protein